jgi:hypothetical protein
MKQSKKTFEGDAYWIASLAFAMTFLRKVWRRSNRSGDFFSRYAQVDYRA